MKKLNIVLCLVLIAPFYGCTKEKPTVTLDLSAYNERDGDELSNVSYEKIISFYKDEARTEEEIHYQEEYNETSIDFVLEEDVEDVYISLPIMQLAREIPEQTIKVKDGKAEENAYAEIRKIYVGESVGGNVMYEPLPYAIHVEVSKTDNAPVRMFYSVGDETMEATVVNYQEEIIDYQVELNEEDQSLLEDAVITFDQVGENISVTEEQFSSDDVNIHFLK